MAKLLSLPSPATPDPRDRHGYYSGLLDDGTDSGYWPVLEFDPDALNPQKCPALDPTEWPLLSASAPAASSCRSRSNSELAKAHCCGLPDTLDINDRPTRTLTAVTARSLAAACTEQHWPTMSNGHDQGSYDGGDIQAVSASAGRTPARPLDSQSAVCGETGKAVLSSPPAGPVIPAWYPASSASGNMQPSTEIVASRSGTESACGSVTRSTDGPRHMQRLPSVLESLLASANDHPSRTSISCSQVRSGTMISPQPSSDSAASSIGSSRQASSKVLTSTTPQSGSTEVAGRQQQLQSSLGWCSEQAEPSRVEPPEYSSPVQHHIRHLQSLPTQQAYGSLPEEAKAPRDSSASSCSGTCCALPNSSPSAAAQHSAGAAAVASRKPHKKRVCIKILTQFQCFMQDLPSLCPC